MIIKQLLPQTCRLCLHISQNNTALCDHCTNDLQLNTHACETCARPMPEGQVQCGICQKSNNTLSSCTAPFIYEGGIKHLLHELKFKHQLALSQLLADLLYQHLQANGFFDKHTITHLLPVPSHPNRLRYRGFNQAQELCKALSAKLHLPILSHHIEKERDTAPQTELSAGQRASNLKQAFRLKKALPENASIVIVDDIITTGTTIKEVHSCLRQHDQRPAHAWAIAKTQ